MWFGIFESTALLTLLTRCVIISMIKSFKDKAAENLFFREFSKRIPESISRRAQKKLAILHYADELKDLEVPPSNHLESLKGDRAGQYSIRINLQWRICFNWKEGNAYNVEIVDYH